MCHTNDYNKVIVWNAITNLASRKYPEKYSTCRILPCVQIDMFHIWTSLLLFIAMKSNNNVTV